jgi:hypothetical protein
VGAGDLRWIEGCGTSFCKIARKASSVKERITRRDVSSSLDREAVVAYVLSAVHFPYRFPGTRLAAAKLLAMTPLLPVNTRHELVLEASGAPLFTRFLTSFVDAVTILNCSRLSVIGAEVQSAKPLALMLSWMSRVSTVSKHLDIESSIQDWTMQMPILKVCSTVQGGSSEPSAASKSNYRCRRRGLCDLGASAGRMCRAIFFRARAS